MMTKEFVSRVLREMIVDTKKYRYIRKDCTGADEQWFEICRIPLAELDTTSDWVTVYDSRNAPEVTRAKEEPI